MALFDTLRTLPELDPRLGDFKTVELTAEVQARGQRELAKVEGSVEEVVRRVSQLPGFRFTDSPKIPGSNWAVTDGVVEVQLFNVGTSYLMLNVGLPEVSPELLSRVIESSPYTACGCAGKRYLANADKVIPLDQFSVELCYERILKLIETARKIANAAKN